MIGDLSVISVGVHVHPYGNPELKALVYIVQGLGIVSVVGAVIKPYYCPLHALAFKFCPVDISVPLGDVHNALGLLDKLLALGVIKRFPIRIGPPKVPVIPIGKEGGGFNEVGAGFCGISLAFLPLLHLFPYLPHFFGNEVHAIGVRSRIGRGGCGAYELGVCNFLSGRKAYELPI